jgi:nickel transport protein
MKIRRFVVRPLLVAALFCGLSVVGVAHAHGIWFAQRATQQALIYGQGADDLDSVKRQPLVTAINGYDETGTEIATSLRVSGPLLLVDAEVPPSVLSAVLFNGIWSKKPDGEWVKKGRDEVPNALVSEKNYKYAVAIVGPLTQPLSPLPSQKLQILPVSEIPALLERPLKLRVLYDGKPISGARINRDFVNDPDAKTLRTAADGTVTIRVRNQGLNVVSAVYNSAPDEPGKVDHLEHFATLAFTLPHAPE